MKFKMLLSLIILITLSHHSSARADDEFVWVEQSAPTEAMMESTVPESLMLIGRGIENRQTHEILAATCLDSNCTQIQFVYFKPDGSTQYVGGTYTIAPSKAARRQLLKKINRDFRKSRQDKRDAALDKNFLTRIGTFALVTGPVILGAKILVGASVINPVVGVALLLPTVAVVGYTLHHGILNGRTATTQAFHDQNGWNWSSRPKGIGNRKFNQFLSYL